MPELLLEVGCEELPASFVRKAYEDLRDNLTNLLEEAGVLASSGVCMGTPRRLIVSFSDLRPRQEDRTVEQRGPAIAAAYKDGEPTPALLGFCRSQGVEPSQLRQDEKYVWATKTIAGRDTRDLLADLIPQAIRSLQFEKSMRWGSGRMRFARPIRWILAAFGGAPLEFEVEGVRAGLESRGHRFYAPEAFKASGLDELEAGLRERFVEPEAEARRKRILEGSVAVANGKPEMAEALIDENVFLTEWPTALEGEFRQQFEELPEPVLVTAMAKHQRFFPVRDADGKLTNRFISIRNAGEDDTVRRGNEWVLNARFNDAKFFFDEDSKQTLDEFLERTSGILFQEKLGTVRQRADRLSKLAKAVALFTQSDHHETAFAEQAGLYSKADLSTGLVSELASLQGVIGGEYARREGMPPEVCHAVATHYDLAKNPHPSTPAERTAVRLTIADALDKLAGYLGLGLVPSGSSDPFGLRRAATVLIDAAWSWPEPMGSYAAPFSLALGEYEDRGVAVDIEGAIEALADLFESRYEALVGEVRHDILAAAIEREQVWDALEPQAVRTRIRALQELTQDTAFVQTATRPANLLAAAVKKEIPFERAEPLAKLTPAELDSPAGEALLNKLRETEEPLKRAAEERNAERIVELVKPLAEPINAFFDSTMVMVEDEKVRSARITLLHATNEQLLRAGDFTKIVIEG